MANHESSRTTGLYDRNLLRRDVKFIRELLILEATRRAEMRQHAL
jgi:hypothetical protein